MEDATNGINPGEGQKTQKLLQWWSEAKQSDTPPRLFDVLINYGVDPKLAKDFLDKVYNEPGGKDTKANQDNRKRQGGFEFLAAPGSGQLQPATSVSSNRGTKPPGGSSKSSFPFWFQPGGKDAKAKANIKNQDNRKRQGGFGFFAAPGQPSHSVQNENVQPATSVSFEPPSKTPGASIKNSQPPFTFSSNLKSSFSFEPYSQRLEEVLAEDNWPPEQEILAKLMGVSKSRLETVLQLCLKRQTSAAFLEAVCTRAVALGLSSFSMAEEKRRGGRNPFARVGPSPTANPAPRPALDHGCVVGVRKLLRSLSSLVVNGKWESSALAELFGALLETTKLGRLEVSQVALLDNMEKGTDPLSIALPESTHLQSSIHTLIYHSNRLEGKSGGGVDALVSGFMKRLLKLNMLEFRGDLEVAVPQVIQLLQRPKSTLRQLSLCGLVTKLGVYVGDLESITSVQPLLQLLEALKGNDTLKSLHLKQLEDDDLPACQEKLAEVLQEGNTTLSEVQINGNFCGGEGHYYLRLNKAGRGVARDPKTTVSELVGLLLRASFPVDHLRRRDSFHELLGLRIRAPLPMDDDRQEIPFDIAYGLLRELPGMWSQQKKSRKRKLGDMAEGGAYLYNGPAFKSGGNGR